MLAEDRRLGSFDPDSTRAHMSALRSVAGAIEELEAPDLQGEIDRTALLGEIRSSLYRLEHEQPQVRNPAFWLSHLFQSLYTLLTRAESNPATRAPAAVARLEGTPAFLDAALATLDRPATVFVDTALTMLGGGGELITQTVKLFSSSAPAMSLQLQQAGEAALRALVDFGGALRDRVEPDPDPLAFAVGETQFSRRLHHEHAIAAGPAELRRYGLRLQEEVTRDLQQLASRLGAGPWRDLVDRLREDSPEPERLLGFYQAEVERARQFVLDHDVVALPDGGIEVVPTPAYLTSLVPFAAYDPPPVFLPQRTGRFYVTQPDPSLGSQAVAEQRRAHSRHTTSAMVVHEGYPGHHLQLVTMQALGSEVRRHIWTPVMVEGWAVYCEQMMAEVGYYQSDESRLFQLVNLLWRAIRVVLDVDLHTGGLSPGAAVDYMVKHLPIERRNAEAEVRRYCAWPTYQLCYAVGRRELLSLREAHRAERGDSDGLRQFHDELMQYGGIPVALARWGMALAE